MHIVVTCAIFTKLFLFAMVMIFVEYNFGTVTVKSTIICKIYHFISFS